ncbi:hypothetical protein [Amycolatopsis sp. cg9]|uniref:hypothetical protein n=1 Tax=Amycolatopsis sp. cg9 TaxID=3238801 RepID=UPI003523DC27
MSQALTRDDVVVSKPHKKIWVPFLLRARATMVSVAGRDYKIVTLKVPFGAAAAVSAGDTVVAKTESADIEQAIAALLDVLNAQQDVDAALDAPDTQARKES